MYRDYVYGSGSKSEESLTAAEHVDTLTGFQIQDFTALTVFQQRIIKRVHARLEAFERENADILDTPLTSYSVNGVSMTFDQKVKVISGVTIPADLYAMLCSTGLCYPAV